MNRKGFMVMLGVILINTILAILVVVLGIVIKSRIFIQRKGTSYEKISE